MASLKRARAAAARNRCMFGAIGVEAWEKVGAHPRPSAERDLPTRGRARATRDRTREDGLSAGPARS